VSAVTDDMPAYTVALAKFQAAREELDRLMPASVRAKLQASRQQAPELVAATFRCKKCGSEWTAPVLSDEIDGACPECDPPEHKPQ
jgi:hypothetical protein